MASVNVFRRNWRHRVPFLAGLFRRGEPARVIPIYSQRRGKKFSARVTLPAK